MTVLLSIPPVAQGESSSPAASLFGFVSPLRLLALRYEGRRAAWSRLIPAAFSFSWPGAPRAGFARGALECGGLPALSEVEGPPLLRSQPLRPQRSAAIAFVSPPPLCAPRAGFARGGRVYPAPSFGVRRPCRRFSVRSDGRRYPILRACPESRRVPHRSRFFACPSGGRAKGGLLRSNGTNSLLLFPFLGFSSPELSNENCQP